MLRPAAGDTQTAEPLFRSGWTIDGLERKKLAERRIHKGRGHVGGAGDKDDPTACLNNLIVDPRHLCVRNVLWSEVAKYDHVEAPQLVSVVRDRSAIAFFLQTTAGIPHQQYARQRGPTVARDRLLEKTVLPTW